MVKGKDIIKFLENKYPVNFRAKWDFTDGLLQGNVNDIVKKVVVCLELRPEIIMKDTHTFHSDPERIEKWTEIASRLAGETT